MKTKKKGRKPAAASRRKAVGRPAGRGAVSRPARTQGGREARATKAAPPRASKVTAATARPPRSIAPKTGGLSMANVTPLRDRILVRRIEETEEKIGGIIVPDTAKEKPQQAEVKAVGSGRILDNGQRVALDVKAGDKVLIGKWSGTEVKIDGEEYLILKEDEVLGVLE
jgi:chaperonin GroES